MERKTPTIEEVVGALSHVNTVLADLQTVVQTLLDDHENFTLIPLILAEAKKSNKGAVSPAWIGRKYQKGYARSSKIIQLMLTAGLVAPALTRNKHKYLVV